MLSLQGMELINKDDGAQAVVERALMQICRVKNDLKCLERQRFREEDSEGVVALSQEPGSHKAGPERQDMPLTGKTCSSCELPREFQGSAVASGGPGSSVLRGAVMETCSSCASFLTR